MNNDQMARKIGANMRRRRSDLGLSLQDVANRAGMSKTNVWELERGNNPNPTLRSVMAIMQALYMPLNELLGFDASQPSLTEQELALIAAHRQIFGAAP